MEVGCNSIQIKGSGVKSFALYQGRREIQSLGRHELNREYERHPGMSYEEYERRYDELHGDRIPAEEMLVIGGYVIDSRGHLHLHRSHHGREKDVVASISIPLRVGMGLSLNSLRLKFSMYDFDLSVRGDRDGDYDVMLEWGIRF